ncbi:hypothetical protein ROM48_06360 [Cronobacter malonaticus]|uniref:hypothetical protein n=1 Tax=Cronobacter malonaticus TaxID=413503 RepID=UPI00289542A8|nr:hypothetical protein [Cronobacter malonaticus]MDT3535641.1 hypothetical protein [Cronobacter malonaticus]
MDKSREQFDQWLKQQGLKPVAWIKDEYWKVWKASRAAVEIKIPEGETVFSTATDSYGDDGCVMLPVETMKHVIRAAGIKVKGE